MKAGRLRHRVRLERQVQSTDAYGAPVRTWQTIIECPADITFVSGREFMASERDLAEETVRIFLRVDPRTDLDPAQRAIDLDTGAEYDIRAVLKDHVRAMATLVCRSGSSHS